MFIRRATLAFSVFVAVGCCCIAASTPEVDIHDPALIKDGASYYLYSTGPGVTFYSAKDLTHWTARGRIFATEPSWAHSVAPGFNGHVWAPDLTYANGKFYLYYSVSGFGKNDSAIGVAVTKTLDPASPDYKWDDQGIVVRSFAGRDDWNAIDANVITDTDGTPWMAFGSFWSGIKLVKLNADRVHLAEPQEWHSIAAGVRAGADAKAPGDGAVEGPFLFHKGDYYYLFVSTGYCCRGKNSTYRVAVGRARAITGPYLDKAGRDMAQGGGTPLVSENAKWAGWGGQGIYHLDDKDYVVMHAYEAANNDFHRLKVLPIVWDAAGWPLVDGRALDSFHTTLKH